MKGLIITIICSILTVQTVFAETAQPSTRAQGAVLMDFESGRVLYGKNEETPLAMASTTKIMTAIIILENSNLDDLVTVSKNAASAPEVRMKLAIGEEIRLEDLLYAMMLKSYNDAAVALAEHVSGSVPNFCELMTQKAKEIGAENTIFGSPNGLDSNLPFEKHHSTAKDMALITRYALNNPKFTELINTQSIEIPMKPGTAGKHYSISNANRFLYSYEGAMGVKTGYTNKAGQCFVGAAKRGDKTLISVVLASGWGNEGKEQKWKDTKALMDYGFKNFNYHELVSPNSYAGSTLVSGSPRKSIIAQYPQGFTALLSDNELKRIQLTVEQFESKEAPIRAGDNLGYATISLDGAILGQLPLTASADADKFTLLERFLRLSRQWSTLATKD